VAKLNPTMFLTYDDVLLKPGYSALLPAETQLHSRFSRNIHLNIPIVSAAMDTVTEAATAIVMAQEGGIGVIHKNLPGVLQALEVQKVKKYESGMILDPVTVDPELSLQSFLELRERHKITGCQLLINQEYWWESLPIAICNLSRTSIKKFKTS
jgi:IMP dehydrogenase